MRQLLDTSLWHLALSALCVFSVLLLAHFLRSRRRKSSIQSASSVSARSDPSWRPNGTSPLKVDVDERLHAPITLHQIRGENGKPHPA